MHKIEFKPCADGDGVDAPDGCWYHDNPNGMYFYGTGLCGCGSPEEVHAFLIEATKCFHQDWEMPRGTRLVEGLILKQPDVVAEFVVHFLDSKGFLEHGGSVFGAWQTERGKQFIAEGPHEFKDY